MRSSLRALLFPTLAALAPLWLAAAASALPSFGTRVDAVCTSNGWLPPRPFNPQGGNPNDPAQANCGLCHANAASPNGNLTAAGDQFRRSGRSDVAPFCAPAPSNRAPVFAPVGPQSASVGQLFELAVSAVDPEGGALLLAVSNAPAGHLFRDAGNGSGSFRWTPSAAQLGSHSLRFHAADTGSPMAVAALDVAIAVGPAANLPPVLAPIGNQQVDPGAALAFSLSAADPEGSALRYAVAGAPAGAQLVGADFSFTPDASQRGDHALTFTVSDAGTPPATDAETLVITVGAQNRPPVLAPIGDRQGPPGSELRVPVSASDPDGDRLVLACAGLPPGAVFSDRGDGSGEIVWLPLAAARAAVTCAASDDATPPASDGESFALAALAPAAAGAPALEDAWWKPKRGRGKLRVRGALAPAEGAAPRAELEVYAVLADGAQVLLGSGRAKRSGRFRLSLEPFVAPCAVAVASGGMTSAAISVRNAPGGCGEELLLRARAHLECASSELRVAGRRGPPGGLVALADADTGAPLARLPASPPRGSFAFEGLVAKLPRALAISAESGGRTWSLAAPLALPGGAACAEREEGREAEPLELER